MLAERELILKVQIISGILVVSLASDVSNEILIF